MSSSIDLNARHRQASQASTNNQRNFGGHNQFPLEPLVRPSSSASSSSSSGLEEAPFDLEDRQRRRGSELLLSQDLRPSAYQLYALHGEEDLVVVNAGSFTANPLNLDFAPGNTTTQQDKNDEEDALPSFAGHWTLPVSLMKRLFYRKTTATKNDCALLRERQRRRKILKRYVFQSLSFLISSLLVTRKKQASSK